jgi:hypothetical protein
MRQYHKAYLVAFIISLFLVWSPSNALAYLAPIIALVVFIAMTKSGTVIQNVIAWFLVWGIIICSYILFTPDFVVHSALLSVLTYSSFIVVMAIPRRFVASLDLMDRMLKWARWIVVIEALVGITQGIYGFNRTGSFDISNGDFVEGTIHPALASELSLSNPMFAINMALLLIALLPDLILRRKGFFTVLVGSIALIMASVLHVLIMLASAGFLSILFFWPISLRRSMTYLVGTGLTAAVILAFFALRTNFSTADGFARLLLSGESYRSIAIQRAVIEMPRDYPLLPLVGLGPGQFSSRAGLIGTGLYFGGPKFPRPLPFVPQGMSQAFEDNTLDLWLRLVETRTKGSTHLPFLSWLSVYVEWGVLVLLAVFCIVLIMLIRLRSVVRSYPQRVLAAAFGTGVIFLLFIGMQENYWEVPQAILIGLLILKVQYSILMDQEMRRRLV